MLKTGDVVDRRYRIERQLGEGGMGAVYAATHLGTGKRLALKIILSKTGELPREIVERFQREARSAGSLDTPHVVQIVDTGIDTERGLPFMTMELLKGEDVSDLIHRAQQVPWKTAVKIVAQACVGLGRAHDAGVVHRDIKSANLYLAFAAGGDIVVKVLDFGIAKIRGDGGALDPQSAALTRTGSLLGSPLYMSPEQMLGAKNVDSRADLWSLGVVLYEALAGRTPNHDVDSLGKLVIAICHQPAAPVQSFAPWVPNELAEIVHRTLRISADERYQTAEDLRAALLPFCDGDPRLSSGDLRALNDDERAQVARPPDPRASDPALVLAPTMAPVMSSPMAASGMASSGIPSSGAMGSSGAVSAPAIGLSTTSPFTAPTALAVTAPPKKTSLLVPVGLGASLLLATVGGLGIRASMHRSHAAASQSSSPVETAAVTAVPEPSVAAAPTLTIAEAAPDAGHAERKAGSHRAPVASTPSPAMASPAAAPAPAPAAPAPANPKPKPANSGMQLHDNFE